MAEWYIAPQNVVYGYDNFDELGKRVGRIGKKAIILSDDNVFPLIKKALKSIADNGIESKKVNFAGECSYYEIQRIADLVKEFEADVIVGFGGGKILDTVKYAGYLAVIRIVTVPTSAATCAAWSSHSAIYDKSGTALEYAPIYKNPDLVFIDEKILVEAPIRLIKAGIADSLAKWIETKAYINGLKEIPHEAEIAALIAHKIYMEIIETGFISLESYKKKEISKELRRMFYNIIINSGLVGGIGGGECRAVGAHSLNNGFTALFKKNRKNLHGETVAFGNIVQMVLDKRDRKEIHELVNFYKNLGIPSTLSELGFGGISVEEFTTIIERTLEKKETIWNLSYDISEKELRKAVLEADLLGYHSCLGIMQLANNRTNNNLN